MPITTKDSILKQYYEANGQESMFGRDNLQFKTVNHPLKHKFVELCSEFKLKKISTELKLKLNYFDIAPHKVNPYITETDIHAVQELPSRSAR